MDQRLDTDRLVSWRISAALTNIGKGIGLNRLRLLGLRNAAKCRHEKVHPFLSLQKFLPGPRALKTFAAHTPRNSGRKIFLAQLQVVQQSAGTGATEKLIRNLAPVA